MQESPVARRQPDGVANAVGLTDEQAFHQPVPASDLTIAGVIKRLSCTERWWFTIDFAGLGVPWPWPDDDPHGCFPIRPGDGPVSRTRRHPHRRYEVLDSFERFSRPKVAQGV